jgi:magnesium transporter
VNQPEWHDLRDSASPELDQLAARFHLHPLHIEDCRHRSQRGKIEEQNGYIFVVLKPVAIEAGGAVAAGDLDLFIGPDYAITIMEECGPEIAKILDAIHASGITRPDQILYKVFDAVVDSYLPLLDGFDEKIDVLEDQVLNSPTPDALATIFSIKRALIDLRRVLTNTRDVATHLQRSENNVIARDLWPFFRDVYDHVARNLDLLETQRDLLSNALDVYLSSVANKTNQIVKVLTVLGTATLPAVIITSFYGMNVKGLPWAESPHGALIVIAVLAISTVGLLLLLRRFGWF